ncbi:FUSC family protein [Bacillus sp. SCS-153A]|uniref:FUSC family protein n=1 Tax=Rossellomorea sedimentorum TaxID=3115294 RepID=UPI003905FE37
MKKTKKFKLIGGRVIKTAIAVFLTALICYWLNLPVAFAVITAIVTIEPTAADSIRKGLVRFPASAIGAALAILFTFLFGDTPVTYTLATLFTIVICHKLHLEDGMLVATLTAVAMIPTTNDHYFISFVSRLGSTSIGLVISTLVNIFVLPPNYSPRITTMIHNLFVRTGNLLETRIIELVLDKKAEARTRFLFQEVNKSMDTIEKLCRYQRKEWKYHRHSRKEMKEFHYESKKLSILRQIHYHIGNLMVLPQHDIRWGEEKQNKIITAVQSLVEIIQDPKHVISEDHYKKYKELLEEFWHVKDELRVVKETDHHHFFSTETILLYELLSIQDLMEELSHIDEMQHRNDSSLIHSQN